MTEVYAFSHPGFFYPKNEDNFLLLSKNTGECLAAVADGLGGHGQGELASQRAVESLAELFQSEAVFNKEGIYQWLAAANEKVYSLQEEAEKKPATTLSLVWLKGKEFFIGHVGDSRVYWWQTGNLSLLTQDHSYLNELAQQGRWIPKRYYQKYGHILARTLGIWKDLTAEFMEQDIFSYVLGPFSIEEGGVLVLTTDGLGKHLQEEEMENLLNENYGQSAEEIVHLLLEKALERGGKDNITLIVKKIEGGR